MDYLSSCIPVGGGRRQLPGVSPTGVKRAIEPNAFAHAHEDRGITYDGPASSTARASADWFTVGSIGSDGAGARGAQDGAEVLRADAAGRASGAPPFTEIPQSWSITKRWQP